MDFLKALITCDNSDESHRLQHNLAKAEQDGRCIRRARSLLGALFVFACAGMLAGDIVLPNMFDDPRHHFVRALCILGLASLISQLACFGYLLQHRALVRRLHKQCQRLVLDLVKAQLQMSLARLSDAANQGQTHSTAPSPAPFQFEAASPGGRKSGAA